jgi:zinc transport system ATP-binding protein
MVAATDTASAPPPPLLAARGLSLRLGGATVLDDVALVIHSGEIVTLIGPNGAGKTTLIRILLGQLAADRGEIDKQPGLRVGYVPQRFAFDPVLPLTVRRFLNLPRRREEAALHAALAEVGLPADLLDRPAQAISGGQVQRLLLARALLREPDLLLLDEPLQNVDFGGQLELFRLIDAVRKRRGCGVLMVSHDLHLVMAGTDRVLCLNRHVCCAGAPESVRRDPQFIALFGAEAAAGLALYTHVHDHAHAADGHVVELHDHAPPDPAARRDTHHA